MAMLQFRTVGVRFCYSFWFGGREAREQVPEKREPKIFTIANVYIYRPSTI
jgi:hypothetical protein